MFYHVIVMKWHQLAETSILENGSPNVIFFNTSKRVQFKTCLYNSERKREP